GEQPAVGDAVHQLGEKEVRLLRVHTDDEFAAACIQLFVCVQCAQIMTGRRCEAHVVDQLQRVGRQVDVGAGPLQQVQLPAQNGTGGAVVRAEAVPASRVGGQGIGVGCGQPDLLITAWQPGGPALQQQLLGKFGHQRQQGQAQLVGGDVAGQQLEDFIIAVGALLTHQQAE